MYLFEQPPLLDDVGNGLLFDALRLVDVFEGVEFFRLFMFDHSNLQ